MKNAYDYPWRPYKMALADKLRDVTQMYRCGQRIRESCADTWPELRNMPESIQAFVDANTQGLMQNRFPILSTEGKCAYIDFETISNVYDSFRNFPRAEDNGMIFMIGVLLHEEDDAGHIFVAENMTREAEKRILTEFCQYLCSSGVRRMFHWGHAEVTALKFYSEMFKSFEFIDLCTLFRQSRVALPGMFSYSLKDVLRACSKDAGWQEDGPKNGLDAMDMALEAYLAGVMPPECISRYNLDDCKALRKIVKKVQEVQEVQER
jgi:hypothetical protein